jgi:hypothetical protein
MFDELPVRAGGGDRRDAEENAAYIACQAVHFIGLPIQVERRYTAKQCKGCGDGTLELIGDGLWD